MSHNFYGLGKRFLSEGVVLHAWWKKPFDFRELRAAFGIAALRRGVDHAVRMGEEVPGDIRELVKQEG